MYFHLQVIISMTYASLHLHTQISTQSYSPILFDHIGTPIHGKMVELMFTCFANKLWIIRDMFGVLNSVSYIKYLCPNRTTRVALNSIIGRN